MLTQGIARNAVHTVATGHIRTEGAHLTVEVPFGDPAQMTAAFEQAHQQRFGFIPEYAALIIDLLTAEAIGSTAEQVTFPDIAQPAQPPATARMFSGGAWCDVSLVDRTSLAPGATVKGPAILTEPTGTIILEAGWEATCAAGGNLV